MVCFLFNVYWVDGNIYWDVIIKFISLLKEYDEYDCKYQEDFSCTLKEL